METSKEYFAKLSDRKLLAWRTSYETLIKENSPGGSKKAKTPHMLPAWKNGLELVQAEIRRRNIGEVQLQMFN